MKKNTVIKSTAVDSNSIGKILVTINNTAYIKSKTGKTGLFNIQTNQLIGEMDDFYLMYNKGEQMYYLLKNYNCDDKPTFLSVYDALHENMIFENFEVVRSYYDFSIAVLRSPIDGKIHFFDEQAYLNSASVFDMALDDAEKLVGDGFKNDYFVFTMNGKKGLYRRYDFGRLQCLELPIEMDSIEVMSNVNHQITWAIVYTKGEEQNFLYFIDGKKSDAFDRIILDPEKINICYCIKDKTISVYDIYRQILLLKEECEEIKYLLCGGIEKDDISIKFQRLEYFFSIKQNGKVGLRKIEWNYQEKSIKQTKLLESFYDNIIEYQKNDTGVPEFYLEKNKKIGIFVAYFTNKLIEPIYDHIQNLGNQYYALYQGEVCDIVKIRYSFRKKVTEFKVVIQKCSIVEITPYEIIYQKENQFGMLLPYCKADGTVVPAEYDDITSMKNFSEPYSYYMVEKDGKKGLMYLGDSVLDAEYDTIHIGPRFTPGFDWFDPDDPCRFIPGVEITYFAVKKEKYALAQGKSVRRNNYSGQCDIAYKAQFISPYIYDEIKIFKEIIVFKDQKQTYIYDHQQKLLKNFPAAASISEVAYSSGRNCIDKSYCYYIDGDYYCYKFGRLMAEEVYVTTYETEKDCFEVKTPYQVEHDLFCDMTYLLF